MSLSCARAPETCQPASVNRLDRIAITQESARADAWSFRTQDASGYAAALVPALWLGARTLARTLTPATALAAWTTDFILALQAVGWNGVLMETTRLIVQRPRPFVFTDPARYGQDPAHYTSFYSGHTSFAAATTASFCLALAGRAAPPLLLTTAAALALALTTLTGFFRVTAGRHYPTDVIVGALAGLLTATIVAYLHRQKKPR